MDLWKPNSILLNNSTNNSDIEVLLDYSTLYSLSHLEMEYENIILIVLNKIEDWFNRTSYNDHEEERTA